MRTRTYLIFWTALAISVVLVVVLAGCTSDSDEELPYRNVVQTELAKQSPSEEAPTLKAPTFSNDVLKSQEFRTCMAYIYEGLNEHFHQHYDVRSELHSHTLEPMMPSQTNRSGSGDPVVRNTGPWGASDPACDTIFSSAP